MTPLLQVILTFVIGLLTVGGTWATIRITRPKIEAERESLITSTALSLIQPLNDRINTLAADLVAVHAELAEVREENRMLRVWGKINYHRVIELGGVPADFEEVSRQLG
jgi:hypothetical protein